jgi:hypothetical protein
MVAEWLDDRSLDLRIWEEPKRLVILRLGAPGRVESRAVIPRPTDWVELSADMTRVVVITHAIRGDIWISRVSRK